MQCVIYQPPCACSCYLCYKLDSQLFNKLFICKLKLHFPQQASYMLSAYSGLLCDVLFMPAEVTGVYRLTHELSHLSVSLLCSSVLAQITENLPGGETTPQDAMEAIIMLSRRDVQELEPWRRGRYASQSGANKHAATSGLQSRQWTA